MDDKYFYLRPKAMILFDIQNNSMSPEYSMIRMKKMWGKEVNYDM